jgi:site-specific DNA-cytosine methylase
MIILELFSGQGSISATFKEHGHQAFKVDWSEKTEADLHADVAKLTIEQVIDLCGGVPDVIWASPQCTTYSIATHRHRTLKEGLIAKTPMAVQDDLINMQMWGLIDELIEAGSKWYFVENPKGRMRHMPFVNGRTRHTITYCSYGRRGNAKGYEHLFQKKPTDIWTNHPYPMFKEACGNSKPGHEHGDWQLSAKRDYLNRGEIPLELREHLVWLCESDTPPEL